MEDKVRCLDTKKMMLKSSAFFCELDGKYYSSEEGYKNYQIEKEARKQFRYMNTPVKVQDVDYKMCRKDGYLDDKERLWSSKESYDSWMENEQARKDVVDTIARMLGWVEGATFPTYMTLKLAGLKAYGYKVVYETLQRKQDSFDYFYLKCANGDFKTAEHKASYLMEMINRMMRDVADEIKREEKIKDLQNKTISSYEDIEVKSSSYVAKDLSGLLGDI